MTSQIRAEDPSGAVSDVWDRLAALAFDGTAAHGGCSAQAHECACRAGHAEPAAPADSGVSAARGDRAGDAGRAVPGMPPDTSSL